MSEKLTEAKSRARISAKGGSVAEQHVPLKVPGSSPAPGNIFSHIWLVYLII